MRFNIDNSPWDDEDKRENVVGSVKDLLMFSNVLSLFQIANSLLIYITELKWMKARGLVHYSDDLITSGLINGFYLQIFMTLVQPYWFLYGVNYSNSYSNEHTMGLLF